MKESHIHEVEIVKSLFFGHLHGRVEGEYSRIKYFVSFCLSPVIEAIDGTLFFKSQYGTPDNFTLKAG